MIRTSHIILDLASAFHDWDRELLTKRLKLIGFECWGYTTEPDGDFNYDEEIWGYSKGNPNGDLLILINWIDGFAWVYEKKLRADFDAPLREVRGDDD